MGLSSVAAVVVLGLAGAAFAQNAPPRVEDAWARPTVAGQAAGGGYLRITSPAADRLLGASAPVSRSVELHAMRMDGDVMRMRQLTAIELPAGRAVELKPGGLHLMFIGLKEPLQPGARFPLMLRFEKAGELQVEVRVMQRAAAAAHGHRH